MDSSSECPGQEMISDHQTLPSPVLPQPTDHTPEPEPPAGPESNSDQDSATVGQAVTSVEQMDGGTEVGEAPTKEVDQMKEEAEAHISTSESGDRRSEQEERKEQEEEKEEVEEEEDGLGDLQPENCTQNVPATGQRSGRSNGRSRGRRSGSGPPTSKYNTVCYRKIKSGNTKQRIDEFESMMSV
ncbi:ermin-like [Pygocentrus nattereri]|uniref:ermin-like n=1 Tax=Pygocentrus nattereri TaxID=42514 RepID=UPI001890D4CC|nr:ermin-like [Pygocentrus nattereri]